MECSVRTAIERLARMGRDRRVIVGIDGLSRSGKTTLSKDIRNHLLLKEIPFYIFHIDDYIVKREERYNTGNEQWFEYYFLQWDVEYLIQHLFTKLHSDKEIRLLTYDEQMDMQNVEIIKLPENGLIIIEGVFLQRKEWQDFYDYMIYLDCSREERLSREQQVTQAKIDKFRNRYWKAEAYYVETVDPLEKADLVIKNTQKSR